MPMGDLISRQVSTFAGFRALYRPEVIVCLEASCSGIVDLSIIELYARSLIRNDECGSGGQGKAAFFLVRRRLVKCCARGSLNQG